MSGSGYLLAGAGPTGIKHALFWVESQTGFSHVPRLRSHRQTPAVGNRVSHANNQKRRRFLPNLHEQRFWLEDEKRWVKLRVSSNGLRTIEKNGIDSVVAKLRAQGEKI